jgi:hypothetical protein
MENPRFPHSCTITRSDTDVLHAPTAAQQVYAGSCRRELNKFDNRHYSNASNTAQWIVSLPVRVDVRYGDELTLDDGICTMTGNVSEWETTNITHENDADTWMEIDGEKSSLRGKTTQGMHLYIEVTKN